MGMVLTVLWMVGGVTMTILGKLSDCPRNDGLPSCAILGMAGNNHGDIG